MLRQKEDASSCRACLCPCVPVINLMLDPAGALDAAAGAVSPTRVEGVKATPPPPDTGPRQLPAKERLPEILPPSDGSSAGLGVASVGALPFGRMRPSGKEALVQK